MRSSSSTFATDFVTGLEGKRGLRVRRASAPAPSPATFLRCAALRSANWAGLLSPLTPRERPAQSLLSRFASLRTFAGSSAVALSPPPSSPPLPFKFQNLNSSFELEFTNVNSIHNCERGLPPLSITGVSLPRFLRKLAEFEALTLLA